MSICKSLLAASVAAVLAASLAGHAVTRAAPANVIYLPLVQSGDQSYPAAAVPTPTASPAVIACENPGSWNPTLPAGSTATSPAITVQAGQSIDLAATDSGSDGWSFAVSDATNSGWSAAVAPSSIYLGLLSSANADSYNVIVANNAMTQTISYRFSWTLCS